MDKLTPAAIWGIISAGFMVALAVTLRKEVEEIVKNFIAGLLLLVSPELKLGERVEVNPNEYGVVKFIFIRRVWFKMDDNKTEIRRLSSAVYSQKDIKLQRKVEKMKGGENG